MDNIVLDIDECLVHTFIPSDWDLYKKLQGPEHIAKRTDLFCIKTETSKYWGVKRKGLDQFLRFCFCYFKNVCVWSAGISPYVKAVVKYLFRDLPQPRLVFARDRCLNEFNYYCKPLDRIYELIPGASCLNTILVDNQLSNSKYDPNNIIHIPDYDPVQTLKGVYEQDSDLLTLMNWFQLVKECPGAVLNAHDFDMIKDVRKIYKKNIFLSDWELLLGDYNRALEMLA
jgi:hypothetical protein